LQVRALVDLLPDIEVVVDDPFNSDPKDPKYMGPDALQRFRKGEQLPTTTIRTPLVCCWYLIPFRSATYDERSPFCAPSM